MAFAFFDGSGKQDDHPVVTVSGYLADDTVCDVLEKEWLNVTEGRSFHYTDFGTKACQLGSVDWTDEKRSGFLCRLARIVNRDGTTLISQSVDVKSFNSFSASSPFADITGPAYSCAASMCVYAAEDLLRRANKTMEKTAITFEKGEREHELAQTLRDLESRFPKQRNLRSHHFLPKQTTLLQPADLIAGVAQGLLMRVIKDGKSISDTQAFRPLSRFWKYFSGNGLEDLLFLRQRVFFQAVVNRTTLEFLDGITEGASIKRPSMLANRRKQRLNQDRRTPKLSHEEKQQRIRELQLRNGYDPERRSKGNQGTDEGRNAGEISRAEGEG